MAKSLNVGSRELKTRLGQYLNRVRRGETILVTVRNEPVAELRPLSGDADHLTTALRKLEASGTVTPPTRPVASDLPPIRARGGSGSAAVSADRDERG
jgi:prevent-host-death family protein